MLSLRFSCLAIFDDRIVFQNPGAFPAGYTWKDFAQQFNSIPHNPLIASVFYRRGLTERWGRGIGMIMKKCAEANLPEPVFEVSHSFITLTIRFNHAISINGGLNGGLNLSDRETLVVNSLIENPNQTINEIAQTLGVSKRTAERIVASLIQKNVIEKDGSKKTGVWRIKDCQN